MFPLIPIAAGLAQYAPAIIKWISGSDKAEEAAQKVVDVATSLAGGGTPEEVLAKVQADKQLQTQFAMQISAQEADLDKAYLLDVQDARKRDIAFLSAGKENTRANFMVLGDTVGLVVCLIVLAVYGSELKEGAVTLISTVASIFGLCLRDAHQFEFGSSRGSRDAQATIKEIAGGNK